MAGKYMLKTSDTYFGQNSTKSNDLDKVIWQKNSTALCQNDTLNID